MTFEVPFVRIVILSFDGGQMTLDCIESLAKTDWPRDRYEIVMVDNGSLDDVTKRVRAQYQDVRIFEPLRNLGFAGGCNLGIQAVTCSQGKPLRAYDHVALVNNDATVEPGWLRAMVAAFAITPDASTESAPRWYEGSMSTHTTVRSHEVRNRTSAFADPLSHCIVSQRKIVNQLLIGRGFL